MDQASKSASLQKGFKKAEKITKKYAKTFYFASRSLPKDKRYASYAIYAICRITDDSVDNHSNLLNAAALNKIAQDIQLAYSNSNLSEDLLLAFRKTVNNYKIPKEYFNELLSGMKLDLEKNRYRNFEELYNYCYKVAGVVGLIMLKIFGYANPEAEKYSVKLGVAMQLTNILRDINEDFLRNRIYLPADEMAKFNVSENNILKQIIDNDFINLMKFQIQRAKQYYADANSGIKMIDDTASRLVVYVMKELYAEILTSIERNKYDIFSQRATVTLARKTYITGEILLKRNRL
ncbi:MAG: phytoene/squalene synthase family protein [Candidatus Omnitrophica bacterium]|nr:phytoene/squalene synthase family protein [Candidatus Omnitrophota bacterium]